MSMPQSHIRLKRIEGVKKVRATDPGSGRTTVETVTPGQHGHGGG